MFLELARNAFTALPAALAGATALRYLDLEGNPLAMSAASAAVLASLPALACLDSDLQRWTDDALSLLGHEKPDLWLEEVPQRRERPDSAGGGADWSSEDEEP